MSGKDPLVNSLQSRRQLLIEESELQRVELVRSWLTMAEGAHALAGRARTIGSIGVAAATVVAGVAAFQRRNPVVAINKKPSWVGSIFNGAQLASAVWLALRRPPR